MVKKFIINLEDMDETGGFEDDIIEVIEDRVKKAGGGIGYMLGE